MTAIVNPGGTNEKFARANLKKARILVHPDNVTIFQQIVDGKADLMMTDAIEARLQSRLHPELCAVHPQQPFDFAEKAYLLPRDEAFSPFTSTSGCTSPSRAACCASAWSTGSNTAGPPRTAK